MIARAVPAGSVVSAKMRLGFHDTSLALDCARAIAGSGADELVVHARTRADGYRPPAYWDQVAALRAAVAIPVVANGEIWTVDDALRCRAASGCDSLMLGRGMVAHPGLAQALRGHDLGQPVGIDTTVPWAQMLPLLESFWALVQARLDKKAQVGRLKQWLNFLRRTQPQAEVAYQALRTANDPGAVHAWFDMQYLPRTNLSQQTRNLVIR